MSTQSAKNIFSSGPLIEANSADGVAISTGYDMVSGAVRVGIVWITNVSSVARRFRLSELDACSDFGDGELRLEIVDVDSSPPRVLFAGELGELPPEGIDVGVFEAREERSYYFTLTCSAEAAGSDLERAAGAAYVWSADPQVEVASANGAGPLVRAISPNGAVVAAGPDLRPGQRQREEVTIVNLGSLAAAFRLYERSAGSGFRPGRLRLAIDELREGRWRRIYLGEIGGVPREGIDLGRFEAGESRTYRFAVLLATDTPEEELGRAAGAAYDWVATPLDGK